MYKALKDAKKLIAYEQELINHARRLGSHAAGTAWGAAL
jgi:DNA polymerase III alpha subunit